MSRGVRKGWSVLMDKMGKVFQVKEQHEQKYQILES